MQVYPKTSTTKTSIIKQTQQKLSSNN